MKLRQRIIAICDRIIARADKRLGRAGDGTNQSATATHDATISAVVTRADGSVEDLGVVSDAKITTAGNKNLSEDS